MNEVARYAVFGNPIRHSKSPQIHAEFARQCEQSLQYRAVFVEMGLFSETARRFFEHGGQGINVTVPFKREAWEFAEVLSERARRAGAVNTLSLAADGKILGDNTDGIGLVRDMVANLGWTIRDNCVLLLGAGGAARGIVELLLRESPRCLQIVNRTSSRAEELATAFADLGPVSGGAYETLDGTRFDLVINATSASLGGELPPLPASLLTERSCCYDMMYAPEPTIFMRWAAQNTAWAVADGLGMLVEQAAESFYIWRGLRPQTGTVVAELRASMGGS